MLKKIPVTILAGFDIIIAALSFYYSYYLRCNTNFFEVEKYLLNYDEYNRFFLFIIILWIVCFLIMDSYNEQNYKDYFHAFKTNFIILIITMSFSFIYKQYSYSRLVLMFFFISSTIGIWIFRAILHKIQKTFYQKGILVKNATIIGNCKNSDDLILKEEGYNYIPFNEKLENIDVFIKKKDIKEVFIEISSFSFSDILKIRIKCENLGCNVSIYPDVENIITINSEISSLNGMLILRLTSLRNKKIYYFFKRIFDIFFSIMIIILTFPIIVFFIIILKLICRVDPIFKQKRIGINGKEFIIYKLRTLKEDCPQYEITPRIENNERVLFLGRFLRRFCIDEILQFFNVLKGDMSVVGPRPEMLFITEKYSDIEKRRLDVLPGITGLWQLYGRNEKVSIHENIKYDLYYIEKQSLVFDIEIILKTVFYVIFKA